MCVYYSNWFTKQSLFIEHLRQNPVQPPPLFCYDSTLLILACYPYVHTLCPWLICKIISDGFKGTWLSNNSTCTRKAYLYNQADVTRCVSSRRSQCACIPEPTLPSSNVYELVFRRLYILNSNTATEIVSRPVWQRPALPLRRRAAAVLQGGGNFYNIY